MICLYERLLPAAGTAVQNRLTSNASSSCRIFQAGIILDPPPQHFRQQGGKYTSMLIHDKIRVLQISDTAMSTITIEHNVTPAKLDVLYVDDWPVWSKGVSEFNWEYDQQETCYIIEGSAIITPENGEPVTINRGDMVVFPKGMKCIWKITEPIEKHYKFD